MNSIFERINKIREILDDKAYLLGGGKLPRWRRTVHFWVLVFRGFRRNRGPVRAAALAYTTIISLIPVLALVVSISTGFLKNDQGNTVNNLLDKFVKYVAPQLDLIQTDPESGTMNRQAVVEKIQGYIEAVNSGALGLTAGLALAFIAVTVLSNVESTFNDIWGVTRGRTWSARVIQYWAGITLGPIFIITAVALTSVGTSKDKSAITAGVSTNALPETTNLVSLKVVVTDIVDTNAGAEVGPVTKTAPSTNTVAVNTAITAGASTNAPLSETTNLLSSKVAVTGVVGTNAGRELGPVTKIVLSTNTVAVKPRLTNLSIFEQMRIFFQDSVVAPMLSFFVLSLFLTLVYRLMPATRVKWSAAAVGGLVGGGLLQLNNLLNILWLSKVVTWSKIYGSLGAVPIFLLGLYLSWMIVLLGAQVSYVFQNRLAYLQEKQAESINQRGREFIALRLMTFAAQKFHLGQKPPTRAGLSNELGVPSQLASQVLNALVGTKLLVEVTGDETGYSPGRPIDKITVEDILSAMRVGHGSELATADDPSRAVLREQFDRIVLAEMHAAGSVSLQNLVARVASLPPGIETESSRPRSVTIAA